jgi:hypothetical protein
MGPKRLTIRVVSLREFLAITANGGTPHHELSAARIFQNSRVNRVWKDRTPVPA